MKGSKRLAAGGILGLLGLIALAFASRAADHGDYVLGLALFAGCAIMIMGLIDRHFSGEPDRWLPDMRPVRRRNQWILLIVLAIVGLIGLFVAAASTSVFYFAGIGLFAGCAVIAFGVLGALVDAPTAGSPAQPAGPH